MKEEKTNENNKTIILVIILIIILVIGAFFLGMYVVKNNDKGNSEVNNEVNESDIIESIMPDNYDEKIVYDSEEIRKYYDLIFRDNFSRVPEKILDNIEFVKIDDGKLMWNIDNNWENDSTITNCTYLEVYADDSDETFFYAYAITDDNSLYYYQIDNVDAINVYGNQNLSKITIANKNNIVVKKIDLLDDLFYLKDENNTLIVAKEIDKVKNGNDIYYIIYDINNRVLSIEESKLIENLQIREYKHK